MTTVSESNAGLIIALKGSLTLTDTFGVVISDMVLADGGRRKNGPE